jgi:replicative DNA helicase
MTKGKAFYTSAADVMATWREDVLTGNKPVLYPVGEGELMRIEVGPGLVILLGGAPGSGKSALTMQAVIDALRLTPTLRACVCNIEMPPGVLLDRQLARLSGIPLTLIRKRQLAAKHGERIETALRALEEPAERLCFVRPPFDLNNVAKSADAFISGGAGLIVLDYIQRIRPPGEHGDKRGSVDATMDYLRKFADAGVAVIVVSAVGRSKDKHGRNSYDDGLNLASFRESSELEFGADSAFILTPDKPGRNYGTPANDRATLQHLKDRYGECRNIPLRFDGARQAFTVTDPPITKTKAEKGKLQAAADLWKQTPAADDSEGADDE